MARLTHSWKLERFSIYGKTDNNDNNNNTTTKQQQQKTRNRLIFWGIDTQHICIRTDEKITNDMASRV